MKKYIVSFAAAISNLAVVEAQKYNVMTGNGNSFRMMYDASKDMVKMEAAVKKDTWLGIGFGSTMTGVDMITFEGKDSGNCLD